MSVSKATFKVLEDETGKESPKKEIKEDKVSSEKEIHDFAKELGVEFYQDQFSNNVAVYRKHYYLISNSEFESFIGRKFFEKNGTLWNEGTWSKFIKITTYDCMSNTKFFPLRVHVEGDTIYYDSGKGIWKFANEEAKVYLAEDNEIPVIFRRYKHQMEAPLKETTRTAKEIIEEITSKFNIKDFRPETIPLFFCSEHPHPINLISGDPGAAKSTFSLFIKTLVDPDQVDKLSIPEMKNISDFGMHRQQFYVLLYDNVRNFDKNQSDELCRMVTGGTSITRKLYTDGELYITKGLPRIIINGLRPEPSSFNDLLDRTLLFDMNRITNSKPERTIWRELNGTMAELRYACLRDMSAAMVLAYEQEFPEMPRMSEYCLLGESLNVLWGGELGSFVGWFKERMAIAHAAGMDDPFTIVLKGYLDANKGVLKQGIQYSASEWRFKLEEWGKDVVVRQNAYGEEYKTKDFLRPDMALCIDEKEFPKNANWVGRRFRDVAPLLHQFGYTIDVNRTSKESVILIKYIKEM